MKTGWKGSVEPCGDLFSTRFLCTDVGLIGVGPQESDAWRPCRAPGNKVNAKTGDSGGAEETPLQLRHSGRPSGAQGEERPLVCPRRTLAKRPPWTRPRLRRPKARTNTGASDARVAAARAETGVCGARGGPAGRADRGLRRTDGGHAAGRAAARKRSVKITKVKGWRGERPRTVPSGDITVSHVALVYETPSLLPQ